MFGVELNGSLFRNKKKEEKRKREKPLELKLKIEKQKNLKCSEIEQTFLAFVFSSSL